MQDALNVSTEKNPAMLLEDLTLSIKEAALDIDEEVVNKLNDMCEFGKFGVSLLFVTDVIKNGSYLFFNDNSEEILEEAYGIEHANQGVYLDGMVSRKKQMLPPLLELEERR